MKPFSFRLQKVLDVKELLRKGQSEAVFRVESLREAKSEECRYLTETFLSACRRFAKDDAKPAREFLSDAHRLEATTEDIEKATGELHRLENAVRREREKLLRLSQEKEMVETFKERKLEQYRHEERRYEQKVQDEAAFPRVPSEVLAPARVSLLVEDSGKAKMLVLLAGGLLASFIAAFTGVYLRMVGPKNPLAALRTGSAVLTDSARTDSSGTPVDSVGAVWPTSDTSKSLTVTTRPVAADSATKEVALPDLRIEKPDTAKAPLREKQIRRVATIFSSLTPEAMDSIASKLDDDTLMEILKRSRERKAAALLAVLRPERAARLTRKLARSE